MVLHISGGQDDLTPLHIASRIGDVDTVVLLLQNGAQPDCLTSDLHTPLHIAVKEGHRVVVEALLEHGASQRLQNKVFLAGGIVDVVIFVLGKATGNHLCLSALQ